MMIEPMRRREYQPEQSLQLQGIDSWIVKGLLAQRDGTVLICDYLSGDSVKLVGDEVGH